MTKDSMKKSQILTGFALAGALALSACSPKQPAPEAPPAPKAETAPVASGAAPAFVSAERNSFAEVTSHLDPGGNFYLYLGTEQWLDGVSTKISDWRQLFLSAPDMKEDDRTAVNLGFDVVTRLVRNSGVEEVSGIGISGIAREKGLYRAKMLVHHYPGKNTGFGWSLLGNKPHPIDGLDMLPATTALAMFNDFDLVHTWQIIEKEIAASGVPQAEKTLSDIRVLTEKTLGVSLDKLLASTGGEFGFILTLDEARKMPLPFPSATGETMQIPEPGLLFVIRVKDQTLFNLAERNLPPSDQMVRVDEAGLKMRTMLLPLPFPLRPSIAQAGDYLLISTTDTLIREVLAVKKGEKTGLKSTSEFTRLSQDIPKEGNGFTYVSQRFGRTWVEIQLAAMEMSTKSNPAATGQDAFMKALTGKFMNPASANMTFNVFSHTDYGWLSTANTTQEPAKVMLTSGFVFVVPLLAAIAIPNFVKARSTAQKNACIANLKMIDGASQQWALDKRKTDQDKVDIQAMKEYLKDGKMPTCPAGGTYTTGKVEDAPKCSIPGHELHF
jgi:competence protein ComGC